MSRWEHMSSVAVSLGKEDLALGAPEDMAQRWFSSCGYVVWCTATMAMLATNWCFPKAGSLSYWQWGISDVSLWWVIHPCRVVQRLPWERVHDSTVKIPNPWRIAKTLIAEGCLGCMELFSITKFFVTRLMGAEHRDWKHSRHALRNGIETGDLSRSGLLDVISNIIGLSPLIAVSLKETRKKDSVDSLVRWLLI